jgi:hypothetical protein
MDDATRGKVIEELDALRAQIKSDAAHGAGEHAALSEHVDSLHALVASERKPPQAYKQAQQLEQRLLAWEAEHPQLVALAARVVRALENSGL